MNRIIIWTSLLILILILIILGGYYYYFSMQSASDQARPALNAIPEKSALILHINHVDELKRQLADSSAISFSLQQISVVDKTISGLEKIDSLIDANSTKHLKSFHDIWLSLYHSASNRISCLFLSDKLSEAAYREFIGILGGSKTTASYDQTIIDIIENSVLSPNAPIFSFYQKGITALAWDRFYLEEAILRLNQSDDLIIHTEFQKALNVANKNSVMNVYIKHSEITNLLRSWLPRLSEEKLKPIEHFASYTAWDFIKTTDGLYLNGFSFAKEDEKQISEFWLKRKTGKNVLTSFIPANHLSHSIYHSKELNQHADELKPYASKSDWIEKREILLQKWKNGGGYKIDTQLYDLMNEEFAFVRTDFNALQPLDACFAVIDIYSNSASDKWLRNFFDNLAYKESKQKNDYLKPYRLDASTNFDIWAFPFPEIPYVLFGDGFKHIEANWVCLYRDALIFARDYSSLTDYLNEVFRGNTITNELPYKEFGAYISDKSNQYHYINLRRSFSQWTGELSFPIEQFLLDYEATMMFQKISLQIGSGKQNGMISNDVFIFHHPDLSEKPQTVWQLALDSALSIKPAIVKNHITKEREILIQDYQDKIYLINHAGRILWEKQLEGQIISKIYQVDYFRNNKLQYLFNTKEKVHWIDRNGNDVKRYPVRLHAKASNGLSLVDYDNNRDYRIFIATDDKRLLLYNKEGNLVNDWVFKESEALVSQEVQHFKNENKDFLCFPDNKRLYFLNRKGQERLETSMIFRPSNNPVYFDNQNPEKQAFFIASDQDGRVYFTNTDGKTTLKEFGSYSSNHTFLVADISGNKIQDFVFADNNELKVFDWSGQELFSRTFDEPISYLPVYYEFPNNVKKLGIVTLNNRHIYLINADGSIYPGFPVNGTTQFSISSLMKDGRFNLLVGNLQGFLLQYDVK